ncbi:MAG: tetratricopeptide repeat protein [Cyanobacteriota bacterium]
MKIKVLVIIVLLNAMLLNACMKKEVGDKILGIEKQPDVEENVDNEEVIHFYTKEARYYKTLGDQHLEKGEIEQAVERYEKSIKTDPKFYQAHRALGEIYEKQKDYDNAIKYYKNSIDFHPDDPKILYKLGNFYTYQKDYDKAIKIYDEAIKLTPDFAEAYRNRGLAYSLKGDTDKAISSYMTSLMNNSKDHITYYNLGNAYSLKCPEGNSIFDYFNDKNCREAIDSYKLVIDINPEYVKAYANLAALYQKKKKYDLAKEYYAKALKLEPENKILQEAIKNIESPPKEPEIKKDNEEKHDTKAGNNNHDTNKDNNNNMNNTENLNEETNEIENILD